MPSFPARQGNGGPRSRVRAWRGLRAGDVDRLCRDRAADARPAGRWPDLRRADHLSRTRGALERFRSGNLAFAMNASAVLVKAGAAATTNYASGTAVFVHPEGGLMLELGSRRTKVHFSGERSSVLRGWTLGEAERGGHRDRCTDEGAREGRPCRGLQGPLHGRRSSGRPAVARSQRPLSHPRRESERPVVP